MTFVWFSLVSEAIFFMKFYCAPLEGITGFAFRNLHRQLFPGINCYFAPFILTKQTMTFSGREMRDIDPLNNPSQLPVPQIMANRPDEFNWAADELKNRGYNVVNLNLGCPMPTIFNRKKGSAMLADIDALERFLDAIFNAAASSGISISIKTRLGIEHFDDAPRLMEVFNQFPLHELIIHPRCRADMYKGRPNLDAFENCLQITRHRVCYNGDIFCVDDYRNFLDRFKNFTQIDAVMLARGIIANPALQREISSGTVVAKDELLAYENGLYEAYMAQNIGLGNVLHRMKELWFYLGCMFQNDEKLVHKIRISKTIEECRKRVKTLFDEADICGHFHA